MLPLKKKLTEEKKTNKKYIYILKCIKKYKTNKNKLYVLIMNKINYLLLL